MKLLYPSLQVEVDSFFILEVSLVRVKHPVVKQSDCPPSVIKALWICVPEPIRDWL